MDTMNDYTISVYDPYAKTHKYQSKNLIDVSKDSDLIILAVNHDQFKELPLSEMARVMRNKDFLILEIYIIGRW